MKMLLLLCLALTGFTRLIAQPQKDFPYLQEKESPASLLPVPMSQHDNYLLQKEGLTREELNGKPLLAGAVHPGLLHGAWRSWYQNGKGRDSGRLVKGLPDGTWKQWDENGQLIAVRTYSADKYFRISHEMLRYHPKRVNYPLAALYQIDRVLAGTYLQASYSFPAGSRAEQSLSDAVKDNIATGNSYQPVFSHSLHHGLFMNFYSNGMVKDSGYYKDGLRQGVWIHYDSGKEIKEKGTYHQGIRVGEWRYYNTSGKLEQLTVYSKSGKVKKNILFK
jgi:antitoxin component YwqK of YwqJK toxin-antitoxin module